jgi:hypothetical protein
MKLQVLFCGLFEFREFVFCFEIWFFFTCRRKLQRVTMTWDSACSIRCFFPLLSIVTLLASL